VSGCCSNVRAESDRSGRLPALRPAPCHEFEANARANDAARLTRSLDTRHDRTPILQDAACLEGVFEMRVIDGIPSRSMGGSVSTSFGCPVAGHSGPLIPFRDHSAVVLRTGRARLRRRNYPRPPSVLVVIKPGPMNGRSGMVRERWVSATLGLEGRPTMRTSGGHVRR
jgi:hypothetical protein